MMFAGESVFLISPDLWKGALEAYEAKSARMSRPTVASVDKGIGVVNIHGLLLPTVPQEWKDWGFDATGYDEIAAQVKALAANRAVSKIVLSVDSGGGLVRGVDKAADAIYEAAQTKPVIAYVDGMAASAAYWLASQASEIQASPLSEIGSIGVYSVVYDQSKYMERQGVIPYVVRSGQHKGTGLDAVTPEQLDAQQDLVNGLAAMFVNTVARGRSMTAAMVEQLATGRTWLADTAKDLNLVNRVGALDLSASTNLKDEKMSENIDTKPEAVAPVADEQKAEETVIEPVAVEDAPDPVAVERKRVLDILAAFASDPAFAGSAINAGLSLDAAKVAHYDILVAKLAAQPEPSTGADPVGFTPSADNTPGNWNDAVKHVAERDGIALSKAGAIAAKEFPALFAARF